MRRQATAYPLCFLMYDAVQTASEFVFRLCMSFQLTALGPNREVFFFEVFSVAGVLLGAPFKKHNTKE